jgi:hypothetical protein
MSHKDDKYEHFEEGHKESWIDQEEKILRLDGFQLDNSRELEFLEKRAVAPGKIPLLKKPHDGGSIADEDNGLHSCTRRV